MVLPRVGAGLDAEERVAALGVGHRAADPVEVGIEPRRPVVAGLPVTARRVGLPDLDQRVGHRFAVGVEHAAAHDDPLPDGLAVVLAGQVAVAVLDPALAEQRTGDLGQPLREHDERLRGMAQRGAAVVTEVQRGLLVRIGGKVRKRHDVPSSAADCVLERIRPIC